MGLRQERLERIWSQGFGLAGFGARYDASRPKPEPALLDLLCRAVGLARPRLVVDLGSGTGLSTFVWADRAEQVVGVEPNPEMRRHAEARGAENVSFVDRFADESGLDDGCADIVTIAHAFNWMDPGPTLAEVARVLRPGGLLAIFDYHWPPYITHAIDASFKRHLDAVDVASGGAHTRAIAANLSTTEAIRASGHFAHVRETFGHQVDEIDAEGIVDLARTSGAAARLLAEGWTEDDLALTDLARTARTKLGSGRAPAWIGYQLRLAVTPRESA